MLQFRSGKRTGLAAICIAADLVKEEIFSRHEAMILVEPGHVGQLLHPHFTPKALAPDE